MDDVGLHAASHDDGHRAGGVTEPTRVIAAYRAAVEPTGWQVLGLAHLQPIIRAEHRQKPASNQRHRGPEGEAWEVGVEAVGTAPEGATWLHVSDRESDVYGYMAACVAHGCGFVIRACRNRKVGVGPRGREAGKLIEQARALLPRSGPRHTYTVTVPATKQAPRDKLPSC